MWKSNGKLFCDKCKPAGSQETDEQDDCSKCGMPFLKPRSMSHDLPFRQMEPLFFSWETRKHPYASLIPKLVRLADALDKRGLRREADIVDGINGIIGSK